MHNSIKKVRVRENPSAMYFMKEYRTSAQWPVGNRDENKNELDYNLRMRLTRIRRKAQSPIDKTLICDNFILITTDLFII